MPHPSKDFIDLASQFFRDPGNHDLWDAGAAIRDLRANFTHVEERTRPFVASVFWQAYLHSQHYEALLARARSKNPKLSVKIVQVVPHGDYRFDLLILANDLASADEYIVADAKPALGDLVRGSERFRDELRRRPLRDDLINKINHEAIAAEALDSQPFSALILPAPRAARNALVPKTPVGVSEPSTRGNSTAGVVCRDAKGRRGVTAAWHAVKDSVNGKVTVAGSQGVVRAADPLSDSAFVEVAPPAGGGVQAKPLKGLVPRQHEPVTFVGCSSGAGAGRVTGWDPRLPFVSGNAQLVVTTDPISKPGDSGAGLLDGQGMLLGFCHETSAFGVANPYSAWIWADQVFAVHGLS